MMRNAEEKEQAYNEVHIPFSFKLFVRKVRAKAAALVTVYMERVLEESEKLSGKQKSKYQDPDAKLQFLLSSGVRFAFKVHQFAGGLDEQALQLFDKLRALLNEHMETLQPNAIAV
eukprot:c12361_g1_i1.p2 GENE.c12361_g1_i1~~c12361_g1_i1.p2  ORF type:complete len:116 (+),score=40.40 c12361_g1_i1:28-375(+)